MSSTTARAAAVFLTFVACPALALAADAATRTEWQRVFSYDAKQPLETKLTLLYDRDGVRTYDLLYASPKGGMVTGFLVTPSGNGPFAGVVFGHWGPGDRTEFLPEARIYAEAGAVSVMIDNPWNRPAPWRKPQGQGLDEPEKDRDSWINAVVDLRRAIDVLAARPDVDLGRIGYVGHSYGAQWGAVLSAVDDRVRAVVLMGGVPDTDAIMVESHEPDIVGIRERYSKEQMQRYLEINRPIDGIRYVGDAAPTPLLFQFARHERYFAEPAMKRYAQAASEPKEVRWYDTGHDLNDPRALAERAAWLGPKIGLAPVLPILERRIAGEAGNRADEADVEPIRVFVTALAPVGAAPDPALLDSRSDLLKALRGKEGLLLVESPEGADVELRLLRRLRQRSRSVTFLSAGATRMIPVRLKDRVVVGSLVVGDEAQQQVSGEHRTTWGGAANRLADQMQKWIDENRPRLLARRGE
jgi:dienelactone hydrolase